MNFKVGEVVFVKANGDAGVVVNLDREDKLIDVSIPTTTEDGTKDYETIFALHVFELETAEDRLRREMDLRLFEMKLSNEYQRTYDDWKKSTEAANSKEYKEMPVN